MLLRRKLFLSSMILFVLLSFSFAVPAEAFSLQWSRTYGGAGYDRAMSVVETSDGGYVLVGEIYSLDVGNSDFWVLKIDATGNMLWNKTFGGKANSDLAMSVIETSDGGYVIAGDTQCFGAGDRDFWLIKTDAYGNVELNKTYGGAEDDGVCSVVEASDGGYILAGYTASFGAGYRDCWLVKTDEFGNMEWNQTYGGTYSESAWAFAVASDGGYALAGYQSAISPAGDDDFLLIKTDKFGNMLWNKTYGGAGEEQAFALVATSDGGYAIAGTTRDLTGTGGAPNVTSGDFWLIKTDAAGNMEWNQTYGGPDYDWVWSLVETSDGGYLIAGDTRVFNFRGYDCRLTKTDEFGNMEWNQVYGGNEQYRAFSVIEASDGGYAVAGGKYASDDTDWDFWSGKTEGSECTQELRTYEFDFSYGYDYDLYVVVISTNSTVGSFGFGEKLNQIIFNVTGTNGTTGYSKIIIPEDLVGKDIPVYLNGTLLTEGVDYTKTCNGTHTIFEITYSHSTHLIEIMGISTIPEYSSLIFPTLLMTFALVIVIHKKRLIST